MKNLESVPWARGERRTASRSSKGAGARGLHRTYLQLLPRCNLEE
jgi:hypothetical protein